MKRRDIHKIWAEYKGKCRKETVTNFRLKIGHDCLAANIRKIGIYESSECKICQMPNSIMDAEHLLIALNVIQTNKCSRTPSNSTGMPEQ